MSSDFQLAWRRWLLRLYVRAAVPGYLGTIAVLTALILALPLLHAQELGLSAAFLVLLGFAGCCAGIGFGHRAYQPGRDRLAWAADVASPGIARWRSGELRTIVVVPTLLISQDAIKEQVERLEIHYLANPDGDLRFALLTDWVDAATESLPGDDELLAAAVEGIASLNKVHGPARRRRRPLLPVSSQACMERKGTEMDGMGAQARKTARVEPTSARLDHTTSFPIAGGAPETLPGVRYVITLDADTRLPRGTAARLVGTMAHPLNRPQFSADLGRVVDGYGVVQPRITPSLPTDREGSLFQRIFSGPSGIDPYASAVSDVYQDLFRRRVLHRQRNLRS